MNLLECHITKMIDEPFFKYGFWWQKVEFDSHGVIGETKLFAKYVEDFKTLTIGFKFYQ